MAKEIKYSSEQINSNLRRTMKLGLYSKINEKVLFELTDKYFRNDEGNLCCAYTGMPIKSQKSLHLEHIIPVSSNGGTILFNVVPSMSKINGNKLDNNLLDWWKTKDFYDIDRLENIVNYMFEAYELYDVDSDEFEELSLEQELLLEEESSEFIDKEQQEIRQNKNIKSEFIEYQTFLDLCIKELEKNGKDVKEYIEKYNALIENNIFRDLKKEREYQQLILDLMDTYVSPYKYTITESLDYKSLIKELNVTSLDKAKYKLSSRITYLRNRINPQIGYSEESLLHTLTVMPEMLYQKEELFTEEYINKIKDNLVLTTDDKFRLLIKWLDEHNGISPRQSTKNVSKEEGKLGRFLSDLKRGCNKNHQKMEELLEKYPDILNKANDINPDQKFIDLIKWLDEHNGEVPSAGKNVSEEERKLGKFLDNIKRGGSKNHPKMKELLKKYPDILEKVKGADTDQKFIDLIKWLDEHNGVHPRRSKNVTEEERELAHFLKQLKRGNNKKHPMMEELLQKHPNVLVKTIDTDTDQKFMDLIKWLDDHDGKTPRGGGKNIPEEERKLGKFLDSLKQGKNKNHPKMEELLKKYSDILEKVKGADTDQKFIDLIKWLDEHNGVPPRRSENVTEEERKLAMFLKDLKNGRNKDHPKFKELLEKYSNILEKKEIDTDQKFIDLIKWLDEHSGVPPRSSENAFEEERKLSIFLNNLKQGCNKDHPMMKELLEKYPNILDKRTRQKVKEVKNISIGVVPSYDVIQVERRI